MIRAIFFFILFYFLSLLQTSFLAHFSFWGIVPNVLVLLVIGISVFANSDSSSGLLAALGAGFFLDIFSQKPLGFSVAILFVGVLLIKTLKRTYVRIPVS